MLPSVPRVGVLASADDAFTKPFLEQVQLPGRIDGIEMPARWFVVLEMSIRTSEICPKSGRRARVLLGDTHASIRRLRRLTYNRCSIVGGI
jgi:hypothetical protein